MTMPVEQRLNDAIADLEYEMSLGTQFSDALLMISQEHRFSVEGLTSELNRRFGKYPESSILFRIEENRQENALLRIWHFRPRTGMYRWSKDMPPIFRDEIFREAGIPLNHPVNSLDDFKMRTELLEKLEEKYRRSRGNQ